MQTVDKSWLMCFISILITRPLQGAVVYVASQVGENCTTACQTVGSTCLTTGHGFGSDARPAFVQAGIACKPSAHTFFDKWKYGYQPYRYSSGANKDQCSGWKDVEATLDCGDSTNGGQRVCPCNKLEISSSIQQQSSTPVVSSTIQVTSTIMSPTMSSSVATPTVCSKLSCHTDAECQNEKCVCKAGFIGDGKQCNPGKLFKGGIQENKEFDEKLKDKTSTEFKAKAMEIENLLNNGIEPEISENVKSKVTECKKGSTVTLFVIVLQTNTSTTAPQLQTIVGGLIKNGTFGNASSVRELQATTICELVDCESAKKTCRATTESYECPCVEGFVKNNAGQCIEEKDDEGFPGWAYALFVILCILLLGVFIWLIIANKTRNRSVTGNKSSEDKEESAESL